MKAAPYNMLLEAASRHNILTLTTSCAAACVFCSHHQNPEQVEAYYINKLTKEEAENLVEFLDGDSKITIGESATRICEGEPFAFDYLMDILRLIRSKYPNTNIQITTSGINLDEVILKDLQDIGNIELNISLNSSSEEGRRKLYGGKAHMQAIAAVEMLSKYNIRFNGSIVAMPHILGWSDLEQTIIYMASQNAASIRVFVPGFTKHTRIALPDENILQQLNAMTISLQNKVETPVIIEPTLLENLDAYIAGVITDTPGFQAGLKCGDQIIKINSKAVHSRVDAYHKLYSAAKPEVHLKRDGKSMELVVDKEKNTSAGIIFHYDIDPKVAETIKRRIEKFYHKDCLILTSKLGYKIICKVLEEHEKLKIEPASNNYFGGNIMCAGLLVLQDIEDALKKQHKLPQVVFLPQIMFDEKGRDLIGRHYVEIEQAYGIEVVVL